MTPDLDDRRKAPRPRFLPLLFENLLAILYLNVLFILTSLPLVTFGPSIAALTKTVKAIIEGTDENLTKIYFRTFRTEFGPACLLGLGFLGIQAGIGYGAFLYLMNSSQWLYLFFFFVLVLLAILTTAFFIWAFQMLVSVRLPFLKLGKNAVILTFAFPKQTLIATLGAWTILGLGALAFPYSTPLLLLLLFALACFGSTYVLDPIIENHVRK